MNACIDAFDPKEDWFLDFEASSYVLSNKHLLSYIIDVKFPNIKTIGREIIPIKIKDIITISNYTRKNK